MCKIDRPRTLGNNLPTPAPAQPKDATPAPAAPAQAAPAQAATVDKTTTNPAPAAAPATTAACVPALPQPVAGLPAAGCLPPPNVNLSGAPAGRGLQTNPEGWPANSVRTAGGYHVVPDGGAQWRIFAPGQAATDTANTRVWGDPHVAEKDGTTWDFTKSSDFVLGDGTRIFARTSAETGQSVSVGLDIVNGADRVTINGLDKTPSIASHTQDGYEWRAAHLAQNPNRDAFFLRGDQNNVHWVRERNGRIDGVVTGATFDKAQNRYEQTVDANATPGLDPSLRPPLGSRAWGNMLRGELDDAQAKAYGQAAIGWGAPGAGTFGAVQNAAAIHADHTRASYRADLGDWAAQVFGGGLGFNPGAWAPATLGTGFGFGFGNGVGLGGPFGLDAGLGFGNGFGNGFGFGIGNGFGNGFGFGNAFGFGAGGWGSYFQDPRGAFDAIGLLRQLLSFDGLWQRQALLGVLQQQRAIF